MKRRMRIVAPSLPEEARTDLRHAPVVRRRDARGPSRHPLANSEFDEGADPMGL